MRLRIWNDRGITLAEILIAIAIMGIGLAALAAAIPIASFGIQEGNQLSTAIFLANQRMEQVRNAQWTASPNTDNLGISATTTAPPQSGGVVTFPDESPVAAPYTGYARTVRVRDCDLAGGCSGIQHADLRQVTVTVAYTPMTGVGVAGGGATKSVIVTMLIAKR